MGQIVRVFGCQFYKPQAGEALPDWVSPVPWNGWISPDPPLSIIKEKVIEYHKRGFRLDTVAAKFIELEEYRRRYPER